MSIQLRPSDPTQPAPTPLSANQPVRVEINHIDIPFFHLVGLLVKIALASIPAAILIAIIYTGLLMALSILGFSLFR